MPPANFIAAAAPAFSVAGVTSLTFLVPSTAAPGDSLIAFVASNSIASGDVSPAALPSGWSVLGRLVTATQVFNVLRRVVTDTEPAQHAIPTTGAAVAVGGVMLVYRGLDGAAPLVSGAVADVAASTNFPCPSLTLTAYSDLYLGVVLVTSASVGVTPPAGDPERFDAAQAPPGFAIELEVFELLREATGATGAQTATTAAAQTGLAAAVLLRTTPALLAPSIVPDVPGAIGFVTVGV